MNKSTNIKNSTTSQLAYDRVLVAGRKVLRMPINRYWYEMIASGEKREEYREMSKHWVSRLVSKIEPYNSANCLLGIGYETIFKEYDLVEIKNGYGHKVPTMLVECRGIRIGKPKAKWCGAQMYFDDCFIIELGKVFFNSTDKPCNVECMASSRTTNVRTKNEY